MKSTSIRGKMYDFFNVNDMWNGVIKSSVDQFFFFWKGFENKSYIKLYDDQATSIEYTLRVSTCFEVLLWIFLSMICVFSINAKGEDCWP